MSLLSKNVTLPKAQCATQARRRRRQREGTAVRASQLGVIVHDISGGEKDRGREGGTAAVPAAADQDTGQSSSSSNHCQHLLVIIAFVIVNQADD